MKCNKCKHYYITWDARFPHGCSAYRIKSRYKPANDVLRLTGLKCRYFSAKDPKRR
ncbi:MAG: uracil-DNA glycosylase [Peptococcaceae bacterium]|nr:uracil-DNA glycosylase [Peptococcaceae bacterium]